MLGATIAHKTWRAAAVSPARAPRSRDCRIKAIPRIVLRLATGAAALLFLAFAALVLWLRYAALPNVDHYRSDIVASIEKASGMAVSVERIRGGWAGLRPTLSLEGFKIADRRGKAALAFERADVSLQWWALLVGQVHFADVDFYRVHLSLRRGADGLIYLADKPLNESGPGDGAFTEWLLSQPQLAVHEATLTWHDEKSGAAEVELTRVEIALRHHLGHHRAAVTAVVPREIASRVEVRADVVLRRDGPRWRAAGELYSEVLQADLARVRAHLPLPETLRSGTGSIRVWAQFTYDGVTEVVADLNMRDARVQLAADTLPLELASVSGRAIFRTRPNGLSFATEGLRFRLPTGVEAHPGDFLLTRIAEDGKPPHVEVRADGIDLKIAATLLDYFPVPREMKSQVLRFAPRGRISQASLTWSGEAQAQPRVYSIRGQFEDLAVNAVDAYPGVAGLTGSIEGTEAGGAVRLTSKNVVFEVANLFRAPLSLATLETRATWKHVGGALEVAIEEAHFANPDAEGSLSGRWRSLPQQERKSPGYVDVKGSLTRASATGVANYLPNKIAMTRDWLERALQAGHSSRVGFEIKGDLWNFPFGEGSDGRFLVEGDVHEARLKYHRDWPAVDQIEGTFRFENRHMEVHAERAAIFSSRVSKVTATIENLSAQPPVLSLDGEIDTSGADSTRFLRESPLVNGPGAFTRAISVEGPGRLLLHLNYPLWGAEPMRVLGEYQFAGATASVGKTLAMREVQGRLTFTERGVRAPELSGTIFGQPAKLSMASQPDAQVLTTLDGRIDANVMGAYIPEAIAAKMSGMTDWKARIVSGRQGTELTLATDLKGLAIALPEPFSKPAGVARALALTIAHLGADNELTTATLAGGIYARCSRVGAANAERWHVALKFGAPIASEPVRDGVWLYGELASVDADAWRAVFAAEPTQAAGAQSVPGPELRGLDLRMGQVRYMGREFAQMSATLERTSAQWSGHLDSPQLSGDIRWNPQGKGRLSAVFARLTVDESGPSEASAATSEEANLPALDVIAEHFEFRGRWLGKLDLKAEPQDDEWRIDHLDIVNGHAQFKSTGAWRRTGAGPITTMHLKFETENLNALMGQFGYGDYIKRGTGQLEGKLVWPGYPYDFSL
ncbi:MAG TPA: YhdP family protein, partial [Usitatibacter sp.]|nr:YhdP family protein [Usitatibacter sp.]